MEELLYRIKAILRRSTGTSSLVKKEDSYNIGNYSFNPLKQLLIYNEKTTKLTTKESELLDLLCRHGNEILERNFALKTIWIDDNYFNARSMDVYITRLRKYLVKDPSVKILNVHGKGYKLIC
jgi:two-component system OmpR family response regulator